MLKQFRFTHTRGFSLSAGLKAKALFAALPLMIAVIAAPSLAQGPPILNATSTTLVITDTPNHQVTQVVWGTPITLTATVKQNTQLALDGTVVFCDGAVAPCLAGHNLGSALIQVPGQFTAGKAFLTITPTFGAHTYRALYLGAAANAPRSFPLYPPSTSAPYAFTVVGNPPYPTTTSLTSSGTPGNYTLTAKVLGAGDDLVKLTGNVQFNDISNSHTVGTAALGATTFSWDLSPAQAVTLNPYPPTVIMLATVIDANHDSFSDLLFVVPDFQPQNFGQYDLLLLLNDQHGGFGLPLMVGTIPAPPPPYTQTPTAIVTGDFNNDDLTDVAIATDNGQVWSFYGTPSIAWQNNTYFFTPQSNVSPAVIFNNFFADQLAVNDTFNIGYQDIIANFPAGLCLIQNGSNQCMQGPFPFLGFMPSAIAVGDLTGDGLNEVIAADAVGNKLHILTQQIAQPGQYVEMPPLSVGKGPSAVVVADFNGDGFMDIAVANTIDDSVEVYLGDGTGLHFTKASTNKTGGTPMFLSLGDFNDDGKWDLVTGNYDGNSLSVFIGKGDGTFNKMTKMFDSPIGLGVGDFNGDGHTDIFTTANDSGEILLSLVAANATAKLTGVGIPGLGTHNVDAQYLGDTNYTGSTSSTVALTAQPLATTLKLVVQPTSTKWGQQVTLTATLAPYTAQGWSTDGATVTFYDGNTSLGTGTLALGKATLNTSSLSVGNHVLKAVFGGDANSAFAASTSPVVPFTVSKAVSTTTLTAATNSPVVGVADLLTAVVTGFSAPRGNVVFAADGNMLCSVALPASGVATCSYKDWSTDPAQVTAMYQGDVDYAASTSSTLTITATYTFNSKIVLSFDSTTLLYPGATQTRTCVQRSTSALPTGTVQIVENATLLQTISLGGDGCAYWYINPGLAAGIHHIRAHYSGDSNNPGGYSDITDVTVNKQQSSMSVACWNSTFALGGNYQCNVSVWSNAGSPPGNVNYSVDGGMVNGVALSNGNTSFTLTHPALGTHTVVILYPGSTNYSAVSAPIQTFTVQ